MYIWPSLYKKRTPSLGDHKEPNAQTMMLSSAQNQVFGNSCGSPEWIIALPDG